MKKFEFSYRDDQFGMHFVTLYDEDIFSACERILFRKVTQDELKHGEGLDNFFVTGWEDTHFTIHVSPYVPSTTCVMPGAALSIRKDDKVHIVNSILEGLI